MPYVLWQVAPNPKDLLPEGEWVSAFFDLDTTEDHYTVDFNGRRFKYKKVK